MQTALHIAWTVEGVPRRVNGVLAIVDGVVHTNKRVDAFGAVQRQHHHIVGEAAIVDDAKSVSIIEVDWV